MKKSIIRHIVCGTALVALPALAVAQQQAADSTLNRTVVVEQEYNPDIPDAAKVNVLPQVEPPVAVKREVEYDQALAPATRIPATDMQAYSRQEVQQRAKPGYLRLGYGNYNNLDVKAAYTFRFSDRDRLDLQLSMDGMSGTLVRSEIQLKSGQFVPVDVDWKSRYYRTRAAVDYTHAFRKMDLNVAGHFGLSNFNYMKIALNDKQKFTSGDLHIGLCSTPSDEPFQFNAETNLMFYERQVEPRNVATDNHNISTIRFCNDLRELLVRTRANASYAFSEEHRAGVLLTMDNYLYKNDTIYYRERIDLYKDHTALGVNPYYAFNNDDWEIRLGGHIDMDFAVGKKVRVAPDVYVAYTFAENYRFYARATGGNLQNDFRRLEQLCPYAQTVSQPVVTFEQLNASAGFRCSPLSGLWLHLYGGWQRLKDDLAPVSHKYWQIGFHGEVFYDEWLQWKQGETTNAYAGLDVSYDYRNKVKFSASAVYYDWKVKKDQFPKDESGFYSKGDLIENSALALFCFKPELKAEVAVDVRPINPLWLRAGWNYESRASVWQTRMGEINDVYLHGNYELLPGLTLYAQLNNLLNKKCYRYWGYMAERFNVMAGASFRF